MDEWHRRANGTEVFQRDVDPRMLSDAATLGMNIACDFVQSTVFAPRGEDFPLTVRQETRAVNFRLVDRA